MKIQKIGCLLFLILSLPLEVKAVENLSSFDGSSSTSSIPTPGESIVASVKMENGEFVFVAKGESETVRYSFNPKLGPGEGFGIAVDGKRSDPGSVRFSLRMDAADAAGTPKADRQAEDETVDLKAREKQAQKGEGVTFTLDDSKLEGDEAMVTYQCRGKSSSSSAKITLRFKLVGKTLSVRTVAETPAFSEIQVANKGEEVPAEYEIGASPRKNVQGYFVSASPDMWKSNASELTAQGAIYRRLTDGSRQAIDETFYITASAHYAATLLNSPWSRSPYLAEMSSRIVLDLMEGNFQQHLDLLKTLRGYEVTSLLVIIHNWQNKGFDRSNPDMMPANESLGGDSALRDLSAGARELGHRICIHENYYDIVRGAPGFSEDLLIRNPDGSFIPRAAGGMLFVKPSKHVELARSHAKAASDMYQLNATFHDVMPHGKVDYEAGQPEAGILRLAAKQQVNYFEMMRAMNNGPVVTEMLQSAFAGSYDGGCNAYMDNLRNRKLLPFASLLKVHTKQADHGVGYYERWLPSGFQPGWSIYKMTDRELDRYRAMETAFGRVGFIGRQLANAPAHLHAMVREYHLMRAFSAGYVGRKLSSLEYCGHDGKWIDSATAALQKDCNRLRAEYEGGQKVWVNYSDQPWTVDGVELPAWASVTRGPRGNAGTELRNGQITDFASYDHIIFVDARSHTYTPPPAAPPITPSLGAWKDLGNGSFEMEIVWKPQRALTQDFNSFWMFRDAGSTASRPVFSSVQPIQRPSTSQWKPGETYRDMRRITIPATDSRTGAPNRTINYDLVVGMTYPKGGISRPELVETLDQMRVATLRIKKDGGKIQSIQIEPADQALPPGRTAEYYKPESNQSKRVIDFGDVATNGAVVVKAEDAARVITPVPKGEMIKVGFTGDLKQATPITADGTRLPALSLSKTGGKTFFEIPANADHVVIEK